MTRDKIAVVALAMGSVLVAGTGVTYAANGDSFVLGHTNRETAASVLSNSGSGAALSLKTKSSRTPVLVVGNDAKVPNLDSDLLDGLSSSSFERSFKRIVVVHAGATAAAGGASLRSAATGITGATSAAPVAVLVEPGTYDLGDQTLQLPADVSLVGSGTDVTIVEAETAGASSFNGVVVGPGTVADLTLDVTSTGAAPVVNAIEVPAGPATLRGLDINVQGTDAAAGLRVDAGFVWARDLNVQSTDVGLSEVGTASTIVEFWNGILAGDAAAADVVNPARAYIANSQVSGGMTGTPLCANDFGANFGGLSSTCT